MGARLGLLALAIQTVLSFGHVHLDAIAAGKVPAIVAADAGHAVPGAPADKSDGAVDHFCPICALIHLAGTALPALPPALPLPARLAPADLPALHLVALASSPASFFQARAPPSV